MNLIVVGTNHKISPIHLRERLSFSGRRIPEGLAFLKDTSNLKEAAILSTCNRVEIYASAENPYSGAREIKDFISRYHEIERRKISPYLYSYENESATRHLFSVAGGLDSLVLGETEILGQVRRSFLESEKARMAGAPLKKFFYSALSCAQRIQRETGISKGKVSSGSVAVDFLKEKLGSLSEKNILVIGSGKISELVLRYIKKEKANVAFVANRTFEKARGLARATGARAVRFENISHFLSKADVAISATASPHFVIKKEMLEKKLRKQLLILDLALPRDVEPEAEHIKNVRVFRLEDLESVIKKNRRSRAGEAEKAKKIIEEEVRNLWKNARESEREIALSR